MKDDQGLWNFLFSIIFAAFVAGGIYFLTQLERLPNSISLFDFILVSLASFRVTRLFVYDKITQFVRDWFITKEVRDGENGELVVLRLQHVSGPLRTMSELLACPWCFGMWAAFVVLFFYTLSPLAWFPILILAVSGVGSFIQLAANMIGWKAERLKEKAQGN